MAVADYYDKAFADNKHIVTPFRAPYNKHVFHQYTLQLKGINRDAVPDMLAKHGIPAMIYYPVPSHKQNMLKEFGGADFQLPVTDMLQDCVISLPIHTEMTEDELSYISKNFLEVIDQLAKA